MHYKKISRKREEEAASDIGGYAHPGSGAFWTHKGDCSNEFLHVEDKFVVSPKYSISWDILNKVETEAFSVGKTPILRFGFHIKTYEAKNYAVINRNHVIKDININDVNVIKTTKKSKIFKMNELFELSLKKEGILLHLIYESKNQSYLVMEWDYLVNNTDLLIEE